MRTNAPPAGRGPHLLCLLSPATLCRPAAGEVDREDKVSRAETIVVGTHKQRPARHLRRNIQTRVLIHGGCCCIGLACRHRCSADALQSPPQSHIGDTKTKRCPRPSMQVFGAAAAACSLQNPAGCISLADHPISSQVLDRDVTLHSNSPGQPEADPSWDGGSLCQDVPLTALAPSRCTAATSFSTFPVCNTCCRPLGPFDESH